MRVIAREAMSRFGSLSAQAKREPVFVEKAGQITTVILSPDQYQAPRAQRAFKAEFSDWIALQNARVEAQGIPGADLRPW